MSNHYKISVRKVFMLRTVILSPYSKDVSGTFEQNTEGNAIYIKFKISCDNMCDNDILRLYALSTSHAAMTPYLAESFSPEGDTFICEIYEKDVLPTGYRLSDVDTYVITKFNNSGETAIAAAFFGLEWSASRFLREKSKSEKEIEETMEKDMPITRASQLLNSRKCSPDIPKQKEYNREFIDNSKKHPEISILGFDNYKWYKIPKDSVISSLSSVRHTLSGKYAVLATNDSGHFVAGINKNDSRHIAIGIPSGKNICPMPQLSDCTSYTGGYHIAGIFLGEDGQYFEKCLQNN